MLKFIRNIYAHRAQQVQAGRFESEETLLAYLLEPFPFLLMAVYEADERHRLTSLFEKAESASRGRPEARKLQLETNDRTPTNRGSIPVDNASSTRVQDDISIGTAPPQSIVDDPTISSVPTTTGSSQDQTNSMEEHVLNPVHDFV